MAAGFGAFFLAAAVGGIAAARGPSGLACPASALLLLAGGIVLRAKYHWRGFLSGVLIALFTSCLVGGIVLSYLCGGLARTTRPAGGGAALSPQKR